MTAALRSDQVDQWTACSYVLTCAACQIGNERRLWLFDMIYSSRHVQCIDMPVDSSLP